MKNRILILILLFCSLKSFACSCIYNNLAQEYLDADFAGIVTVKKTYDTKDLRFDNDLKRSTYIAELVFEKLYKGTEFDVLNMYGKATMANDDDRYFGSCDLFIQKGERYIIVLKKNSNGEFWGSQCTRLIPLSAEENKVNDNEELINTYSNLFSNIEKHKKSFSNHIFLNFNDKTLRLNDKTNYPESDFTKLNIGKPSENVGFYKVVLDENLKISKIVPIKKVGFRDKEIEKMIKRNLSLNKYDVPQYASKEYLLLLSFEDF
ncbi:hypothetical protein ASG01_15595 [Chryseobacterium sp. Leaf180]|uniref:hypothetical protein n=1 Tax=Chryseobacterium sp. Leaf180 TaxID=1736289 RepID=UPI0006F81FD6|nr:hypothetical protein [Chryseobacterium sp. Leaf180]KQR93940.1 hypothetical protein ASG01_15595 [Chryseobacterium sp. Leaf180]